MLVVTLKFDDESDANFSNFPQKRLTAVDEYKRKEHGKCISFTYSPGYGERLSPPSKKFVRQLFKDYEEGDYTPFVKLLVNENMRDEWVHIHIFSVDKERVELLEESTSRKYGSEMDEVLSYEDDKTRLENKYDIEIRSSDDFR